MTMRRWVFLGSVGVALGVFGPVPMAAQSTFRVSSPDGKNEVSVMVRDGALRYAVNRQGRPIVLPSRLGFEFRGAPPLGDSVRVVDSARTTVDESWTQPWGEVARVRDHHNELRVTAEETSARRRRFSVTFRVFDDGVGFRYELPAQAGLGDFEITDELHRVRYGRERAGVVDPVEQGATRSVRISLRGVPGERSRQRSDAADDRAARRPHASRSFTKRISSTIARMFLAGPEWRTGRLRAALAPMADGVKVRGHTPFSRRGERSNWLTMSPISRHRFSDSS